jgi:hypothetical protein
LRGRCDLTRLAGKNEEDLTSSDRTVLTLLENAGEEPADFLDDNYESRKAELQAAASELTQNVSKCWRSNTGLSVVLDTDNLRPMTRLRTASASSPRRPC